MSKVKQIEEMFKDLVEAEHRYIKYCLGNTCHACGYYGDGECDNHLRTEYLYNAGYRKQEWISVEERLPDGQGHFLIVDKEGQINTASYTPRFGWFSHFRIKNITHWMPLPEAPKGGA